MSNKFTTQQIQDQFASLPADMQQVISSADTASLIQEIGSQHKLRIDAIGVLVEYSGLIMLGLIESHDFVDALAREAGIGREQAANLALDVDTQVFSKVRNSLKQVQYQSTSDTRFESGPDFAAPATTTTPEPVIDQVSIPITASPLDQPVPADIPMATADYNPNSFAAATAPIMPVPEEVQPVSTTKPSALDAMADKLDNAFESPDSVREESVIVNLNKGPSDALAPGYDSASVEQEVNRSVAAGVMKDMPAAIRDAYKTGQAAAPAPTATPAAIKDFQTILEEKMTEKDTSSLNNDPYKESI